MAAIPESNLPGHLRLHDRVVAALELCQESRTIEFKESAPWDDLRFHVVRTTLAMSNLRDGGVVVIGVSERNGKWTLEGMVEEHLKSYEEDEVNDFINGYASPHVRVELVIVPHQTVRFLAIRIPEFQLTPTVCRREGPKESRLVRGAIYVRPIGKPQTTRAEDATVIQDLLDLAAEKRPRRILETARRIGLQLPMSSEEEFDQELQGL